MPVGRFGNQLIRRLERARSWPPKSEAARWKDVERAISLRDSERERIRQMMRWGPEQKLLIDPIPEKIAEAFSDLLWNQDPRIDAAVEADDELYQLIDQENSFGAQVRAATNIQVSEGEVWWRIFSDPEVADTPLIDWHSRLTLIPLWIGTKIRAVAFFTALDPRNDEESDQQVWRHFELHEPDAVHNLLYRGSASSVGRQVDLSQHPETATLLEEWRHGLGMICGWLPGKIDLSGRNGRSVYHSVEDLLLELNATLSTGAANRKLTARKRVTVPASALDDQGLLDPDQEVIVVETPDVGDTAKQPDQFKVLEYSFDAAALIAWQNNVVTQALTRVGISPQFIGVPTQDGFAPSGTALRIRLIPSVNAGRGIARPWDGELPGILLQAARVAALPSETGGFGLALASQEPPAVSRGGELPEDPVERDQRLSQARTAEIVSTEQAVRERNPGWDETQVADEVARIAADRSGGTPATTTAAGLPNLFNGNTPSDRAAAAEGGTQPAGADSAGQ